MAGFLSQTDAISLCRSIRIGSGIDYKIQFEGMGAYSIVLSRPEHATFRTAFSADGFKADLRSLKAEESGW